MNSHHKSTDSQCKNSISNSFDLVDKPISTKATNRTVSTSIKIALFLCVIILLIFYTFHEDQNLSITSRNLTQSSQSSNSSSQQPPPSSQSIISFLAWLLDLVSSLFNTLKIVFQLTALLFIITDLVNFWNLASVYIFLPIEIPPFAKNILLNVWTQFNQPILSFFNVSFNTIRFNQSQGKYGPGQEYKEALRLDISEIGFEPLLILCVTGVQLLFLTIVLKWIKASFRRIRNCVSNGINLEDLFFKGFDTQNGHLDQLKGQTSKNVNFFENLLKNNRVANIEQKEVQHHNGNLQEQSMKNIFDPTQIQSAIVVQNPKRISMHQPTTASSSHQIRPQLKLMFLLHKMASAKIQSTIKESTKKSPKHWSETISIDKFQILSALIISFMPVFLLPIYNTIAEGMCFRAVKQKVNFVVYCGVVGILFGWPFGYVLAKVKVGKELRKTKFVGIKKKKQKEPLMIPPGLPKGQKKTPHLKVKRAQRYCSNAHLLLKQEAFQTLCLFIMNMTIPITAAIPSSPTLFLSLNLMVHILLVASSIVFYPKRSCLSRTKKHNKTLQQFTFLLYHLCFCIVHLFNQMKGSLAKGGYIDQITVESIDYLMGVVIVGMLAVGGMHQMVEFLIKVLYDVFKLGYMLVHVLMGGYDVKELEDDMKKYQPTLRTQSTTLKTLIRKNNQTPHPKKKFSTTYTTPPPNTFRSLQYLQIDFQIQIAKNQIILNKMKLQQLEYEKKEGQRCFGNQKNVFDVSENKQGSFYGGEVDKNQRFKNKENLSQIMGTSFPLTQKNKKNNPKIKRSHTRPDTQLHVKNKLPQN